MDHFIDTFATSIKRIPQNIEYKTLHIIIIYNINSIFDRSAAY